MKRILILAGTIFIAMLISAPINGQCVPDETCVDINEPGEICPANLPSVVVGTPYSKSITIIPPDTVGDIFPLEIAYILVDSVNNLPPGITYTSYNDKYYPDTAYCIDVEGTPTEAGTYNLAIFVTPFVYYNSILVQGDQVKDDTSVVMVVLEAGTGINIYQRNEFQVFNATPNPFSEKTRLGFYIPYDDQVELKVFNVLGEEIHNEVMLGMHGENFFNFDGVELDQGAYFFGITYKSGWYTGKFIKMK